MSRMSLDTAIRLSAEVKGGGNIDRVKRWLQDLGKAAQVTKQQKTALRTATLQLARANDGTIAGIRTSVAALRGLQEQARIGGREFQKYGAEIQRLEGKLRGLDGTAKAAGRGLSLPATLLAGAAGGVGAAVAMQAANAGRSMVDVGLDAELAAVRLRALTSEFGEYQKAQEATARIANTLRISNIEAQDSFASLYASLRPTGVTLDEIEKAFIGFSAAVRNSGATAQESSAALIQLKQSLASGVLQGEELRSIREQAPLVAQAIAAEMGVTIGSLKDLAAEGRITTDIVLRALNKLNDTQLGKLNEQFDTGRQAIKDFNVAAQELGITLAKVFGPTAVSLLRGFTDAVKEINAAATAFRSPTAYTAQQVLTAGVRPKTAMSQAVFNQGANELFKGTSGAGGVGITGLRREAEELAKIRRQPVDDVLFQLMQNRLNRVSSQNQPSTSVAQQQAIDAAAAQRAASAASLGSGDAAKAAEKAAKAAEDAGRKYEAEQIRMQARLAENQLQTNEGLQRNAIELDNQRYENSKDLALKQFEFTQTIQSRALNLWSEGLMGPARAAAKMLTEFMMGFSEGTSRVAEAQRTVNDARRALQQAETVHKQTLANMTERQRIDVLDNRAQVMGSAGGGATGRQTLMGVPGIIEYLTGDKSSPGYRADHGGANYHEHIAFASRAIRDDVVKMLRQNGIQVGSLDRPGDRGYHGSGQALDVPASQVPVGQEDALARRVRALVSAHLGGATGAPLPMSQRLLPGADMPAFQPLAPGANAALVRDVKGEGDIAQARERLKQAEKELALIKDQTGELRKFDRIEFTQKLTQGLIDQNQELENNAKELQLRNRLTMEGVSSNVIEAELQKAKIYQDQALVIAGLKEGIDAIKDSEDKAAALAALEKMNGLYARQIELIDQAVAAQLDQPAAIALQIGQLKADLAEMVSISTLAGRIADGIGSAFGNAFQELITGAASAREVLAGFFQDVAQNFAQMAAEIIAEQMTMIVLQTILKALGAVAGAAPSTPGAPSAGIFAVPELAPRALGGSTASGRPYKVGENGPELFVPYQAGTIIPAEATEALQSINSASLRGLSVPFQASSSTSDLSVPFQRGMEGLSVPFQRGGIDGGMGAAGMGGGSGDGLIRFETVRIGELDFVTQDEAQRIGRESAKQGAALAHKRNVNNVTIRRQAGFS
jgi:tape measure domain-containing protein